MTRPVAREFAEFVAAQRDSAEPASVASRHMAAGAVAKPIVVDAAEVTKLMRVAAQRAAGLYRATKRSEVVWVDGDSQLAVKFAEIRVAVRDGLVVLSLPVRCDQVDKAIVEVPLAVGSPERPAGLFASTFRRPSGPAVVVDAWRGALIAYAWQCLLEMVSALAGAAGKDDHGNLLVPAALTASDRGLEILPMARHRFAGTSGLDSGSPAHRAGSGR